MAYLERFYIDEFEKTGVDAALTKTRALHRGLKGLGSGPHGTTLRKFYSLPHLWGRAREGANDA